MTPPTAVNPAIQLPRKSQRNHSQRPSQQAEAGGAPLSSYLYGLPAEVGHGGRLALTAHRKAALRGW
ncbi:MAG: hypothetical protein IPM76_24180 [Chloroflexi bacterium]|nr:hypothetical protein [Chloroflexota bacterium]